MSYSRRANSQAKGQARQIADKACLGPSASGATDWAYCRRSFPMPCLRQDFGFTKSWMTSTSSDLSKVPGSVRTLIGGFDHSSRVFSGPVLPNVRNNTYFRTKREVEKAVPVPGTLNGQHHFKPDFIGAARPPDLNRTCPPLGRAA